MLETGDTGDLITVIEFAKLAGINREQAYVAIREGRVTATKVGRGLKVHRIKGLEEYLMNTNQTKSNYAKRQKERNKMPELPPDMPSAAEPKPLDENMSFNEAERIEKVWKAKQAELKAKEAEGTLVGRDKVERLLFEKGRKVRDSILAIPIRISHELAAEKDPHTIEQILNKELVRALEELAQ